MCISGIGIEVYGKYVFGVEYNVNIFFYFLDEGESDVE